MSVLRNIFNRFQAMNMPLLSAKRFKGYDLDGNMYFETASKGPRPKRTVSYNDPQNNHHITYNPDTKPTQWQAWMRHTRQDPPTLEELEEDLKRLQILHSTLALKEQHQKESLLLRPSEDAHIESWKPKKL